MSDDEREESSAECFAFGRHVRSLRKQRSMSQNALGSACGLSVDTIRRIEGGVSPRLCTLRRVAYGLDMPLANLLGNVEARDEPDLDELLGMLRGRGPEFITLVTSVVRKLLETVEAMTGGDGGD